MTLALACAAAFVAAAIQRITGLGFVLVLVGPIVLLYGPLEGITISVLLALVASLSAVPLVWRARRVAPHLVADLAGSARGAVRRAPCALASGGRAAAAHRGDGLLRARGRMDPRPVRGAHRPRRRDRRRILRGLHARRERPLRAAAGRLRGGRQVGAAQVRGERADHLRRPSASSRSRSAVSRRRRSPTSGCSCSRRSSGIVVGTLLTRFVPSRIARLAMLSIAWAGATVVLVRGILALLV